MRFHYRLLTAVLLLLGLSGSVMGQVQTAGEVRRLKSSDAKKENEN